MLLTSVPWLRALPLTAAACALTVLASCGGGGGGASTNTTPPIATPSAPAASTPTPPASAASAATGTLKVDWPPVPYDVTTGWPFDIGLKVVGGDGKETWTVKCTPHISCAITGEPRLVVTSLVEDQPVETFITLSVINSQGAKGSLTVPMVAWPKSVKVTSLLGAPDRPGIHLLILNDGFLPPDMGLYRDAADSVLKELMGRPEIAAHKDAWNVHVAEMTLLNDATGQYQASTLGTKLGCLNMAARVICHGDGRVERAAMAYLPHYTVGLLLLNSTAIGGSATGSIGGTTLRTGFAATSVHELGHAFADLADEYVEIANTTPYMEFNAPNLTLKTNRNEIPWRHWIAADTPVPTLTSLDDHNYVGLFEGGGYVSNGIYRPTFWSFMRASSTKALGPVNAEAWARAVYAKGGAWRRVAPAVTATLTRSAQPTGGWLFEAQPLLDRTIAETRWYVDGVERTDQRGAGQLLLTSTGALQVRVDLVDLTGRVRVDEGVVSTLKWIVP